ncbi:YceI family protein [Vulcaniibacterium tengchongense]|uniref:Polyisoprenoid-binding protein YceI n=1 Tax=Vulcaniibacterium tengchongense TaxID=1273429 RepID=A0A3N4V775_9GAMM|nr:YceI family protein [Vulcaniibacterium tengchongense]RPE77215.1 polyisoprenoid-binding protein YceI [Vulcaniibacterium tengchongense]
MSRFRLPPPRRARAALAAALLSAAGGAAAAPAVYEIDPAHTYPSFEADHMGLSVWRGKFERSAGTVTLDREAGTGSVEIRIDVASVDFGLAAMNEEARSERLFDAARYPQATYRGRLAGFRDGAPTRVIGELTLHGATRPVELRIERFKCIPHPLHKRELCGADAYARLRRDEFGIDAGKDFGFDMNVDLRIQVEAVRAP